MTAKTTRWLDLIAFLLAHRYPVTREQIFEKVDGYRPPRRTAAAAVAEAARRKFERDKDDLRSLGIAIETIEIPGAAGDEPALGYRLRPGAFYLPYLELEPGSAAKGTTVREDRPYQGLARLRLQPQDLTLLDRATRRIADRTDLFLADAARSARLKLEFDLPLPMNEVERVLAAPLSAEAGEALDVLQRAVAERHAVRCTYYAIGRDAEAERVIEPYGLFFSWGRWYCVARARDRDARRVFRVDRMRDAALLKGKDAAFAVPPDFAVGEYVGRAPWELSEAAPKLVRVQFAFPESRWVQSQGLGEPVQPVLDDGGAVIEFAVRERGPFVRWLLTFRGHARVLAPPEVANELESLRREVAAVYSGTR